MTRFLKARGPRLKSGPFQSWLQLHFRRATAAISRPWDEASGEARAAATILTLNLLAMWLGYFFGGRWGLLGTFAVVLSATSWALAYSDLRLARLFPMRELIGSDPWGLLSDIQQMSEVDPPISVPRLHLADVSTPLIGSYGLLGHQRSILISRGLIEKLSPIERRALLGNEVQRLRYHLTPMLTCVAAWANGIEKLGQLLDATVFAPVVWATYQRTEFGVRRPVLLGHLLVSPIIGLINRLLLRRSQVFEADLRAVSMMAQVGLSEASGRRVFAQTLRRMEQLCEVRPLALSLSDSAVFTVNPLTQFRGSSYFLVQPRTADRVAALRGEAPRYEPIGDIAQA